jgi:hypothetical protein
VNVLLLFDKKATYTFSASRSLWVPHAFTAFALGYPSGIACSFPSHAIPSGGAKAVRMAYLVLRSSVPTHLNMWAGTAKHILGGTPSIHLAKVLWSPEAGISAWAGAWKPHPLFRVTPSPLG